MRNLIIDLAAGWDSYKRTGRVDKSNSIHDLVVNQIPSNLSDWLQRSEKYLVEGSDGKGNLSRTPWIATFNKGVTTSATHGYYPVYLFKDDFQEMVLEIGFGATQFHQVYGKGAKFFEEVAKAVVLMQSSSKHLLKLVEPSIQKRISLQPTKLNSQKDFNLKAYESCSIFSLTYHIKTLPPDEDLRNDFLEMVKLYDAMVESLMLPNEADYVIEELNTPEVYEGFNYEEYKPRIKKTKVNELNKSSSNERRYSKASDKIGRIGEEFVFKCEKDLLTRWGRPDLASQVILHRIYPEDRTPGWDITSFDVDGTKKFIEVKTSKGNELANVILTPNEWSKAKQNLDTNQYYIYLVSNILGKPRVHIVKNPFKLVEESHLSLEVNSYLLKF